jgi:Spy/CpxP family protein refolding chaperone
MDNSKFLKTVIIILLLINIATLGFMWSNHFSQGAPPHMRVDTFMFLTRELQLDDKQKEQYEQLRNEHHRAAEEIQHKSRELHDALFKMLHAPSADSALVNHAVNDISANQQQLELLTFYHFQKVRAICSPEQQKRFDEVIQDALRMMAPKPPGK